MRARRPRIQSFSRFKIRHGSGSAAQNWRSCFSANPVRLSTQWFLPSVCLVKGEEKIARTTVVVEIWKNVTDFCGEIDVSHEKRLRIGRTSVRDAYRFPSSASLCFFVDYQSAFSVRRSSRLSQRFGFRHLATLISPRSPLSGGSRPHRRTHWRRARTSVKFRSS